MSILICAITITTITFTRSKRILKCTRAYIGFLASPTATAAVLLVAHDTALDHITIKDIVHL